MARSCQCAHYLLFTLRSSKAIRFASCMMISHHPPLSSSISTPFVHCKVDRLIPLRWSLWPRAWHSEAASHPVRWILTAPNLHHLGRCRAVLSPCHTSGICVHCLGAALTGRPLPTSVRSATHMLLTTHSSRFAKRLW